MLSSTPGLCKPPWCEQTSYPVVLLFCFVIIFNSKEQKTLTQLALTMKKASCHLPSRQGQGGSGVLHSAGFSLPACFAVLRGLTSAGLIQKERGALNNLWCLFLSSISMYSSLHLPGHM